MDLKSRLEAFTEARGTIELYDALCLPEAGQAGAVAEALAAFPNHPLADEVRGWLAARGVAVAQPDAADLLRAHGIDDFGRWYAREKAERLKLEAALADALAGQAAARLSANAYALVCVMLLGAGLLGWAAAFGVWHFVPEPPLPGPHDAASQEAPAPDAPVP